MEKMIWRKLEDKRIEPQWSIPALAGTTKAKVRKQKRSGHAPGAKGKYKMVSYCPHEETVKNEVFAVVSGDAREATCKFGHTWKLR